ncbi:MAG TPA: efflux RND transporter periplasmic adaptor subunit [Kofleriaceae bacterium]
MVTPLKKHHGQHGGLIALAMLGTATLVVWTTHPRTPDKTANDVVPVAAAMPRVEKAPPLKVQPASSVVVTPRAPRSRVTATGFAIYDERRTAHISSPVHGFLQKTRATSLGRKVRQGEQLGVIYSAEVYFATVDLIEQVREFRSQDDLNAARVKLLRWGMPKPVLDRIEQTKQPQAILPLVSRVPGTVVAEEGLPRQFVDPTGRDLFLITDTSFAWVFVDVPEADVVAVKVGMPAKLTIEGVKRPFTAPVAYVFRRGEEGMRKVRFDVYKPGLAITQNAAVTAELQLDRK